MDDLLQFLGIMAFALAMVFAMIGPTLKGKNLKEKWNYFYELATRNNSY